MRIFIILLFFASLGAADDVDDINRDIEGLQQNMNQVRRVLQERMGGAGIDQAQVEKARRKVMVLAGDQKFLKSAGDLWNSPARNTLLVAQLIFAIFMYFFKAWRQSKAGNWFTRLLSGLFWSVVSLAVLTLALPALILGEPFRIVLSTLWRVLSS
ncbi:MAG: hypothetical protein EOP11_03330 [Proteobacteria bacterium]|nr:MAG: hypothetical protein EOP11_03330 [Pseudomonadota bacterium]